MAGFLEEGLGWLAEQQEEHNPTMIAYSRGENTITIPCLAGRVIPQSLAIAQERVNLEEEPADFLIRPEKLDFGDGPFVPARGDRIELASGRVYELTPRDGEPCFRPDSQYRAMWRVRTVRVSNS